MPCSCSVGGKLARPVSPRRCLFLTHVFRGMKDSAVKRSKHLASSVHSPESCAKQKPAVFIFSPVARAQRNDHIPGRKKKKKLTMGPGGPWGPGGPGGPMICESKEETRVWLLHIDKAVQRGSWSRALLMASIVTEEKGPCQGSWA